MVRMSPQETMIFAVKAVFSLAAVFLIAVFLVRPMLKSLGTRPDYLDSMQQFDLPVEMEDEIEIPTDGAPPTRDAMLEEARADPRKAARMVSQWIRERK